MRKEGSAKVVSYSSFQVKSIPSFIPSFLRCDDSILEGEIGDVKAFLPTTTWMVLREKEIQDVGREGKDLTLEVRWR